MTATRDSVTDPLLLPEGTRLVHVGPPKTGTTSLQGAFHAARPSLLAQGVRYAGRERQSRFPIYAALERPAYRHLSGPPPIERWHELVREIVEAPEPRVVLSSEILADGGPRLIRRVVEDLDRSRIHVAVTLRPLARILSSQWQQEIRGGHRTALDAWLAEVFDEDGGRARHFWRRHRHDRLIAAWAEAVGVDRVTVVVADDRDRGMILRAFERLTGLEAGTLLEQPDAANRSMTLPEVEAVRAFNIVATALPVPAGMRHRLSRRVRQLAVLPEPDPREPRVETPQWAYDRAGRIAREMVDAIAASGVRVVGDIESLAQTPSGGRADDPPGAGSGIEPLPVAAWQLARFLAGRAGRRAAGRRPRRRHHPAGR
jgi:hypothetical protein